MADNFYSKYPVTGGSGGVTTLNTLSGALTLAAGSGITVTPSGGDTLTIAATAGSAITALTGDVTASGPGSVAATLANTAVTPGSYTSADITIDSKGRITLAANGSGGSGANTTLSNLTSPVALNQDLLPDGPGSRALGADGFHFSSLYASQLRQSDVSSYINIAAGEISDTTPQLSIGWNDRILVDVTGQEAMFWGDRQLIDTGAVPSVEWEARALNDSTGTEAISWENRQLKDATGAVLVGFTASGLVDFNSNLLSNVATPIAGTDAANKAYVDSAFPYGIRDTYVLSGTDITNQYVDLSAEAINGTTNFNIKGRGLMLEGATYDYEVTTVGLISRCTFKNDLATGGVAALVAGDVVQINYLYFP